jgi:hypothetical protein
MVVKHLLVTSPSEIGDLDFPAFKLADLNGITSACVQANLQKVEFVGFLP